MTTSEAPEQTNPLYSTERYGNGRDVPPSAIHPGTPEPAELTRIRAARDRVEQVYPGPVGTHLWKELDWQLDSRLRHDRKGATMLMVDAILAAPIPEPPAAALTVVAA